MFWRRLGRGPVTERRPALPTRRRPLTPPRGRGHPLSSFPNREEAGPAVVPTGAAPPPLQRPVAAGGQPPARPTSHPAAHTRSGQNEILLVGTPLDGDFCRPPVFGEAGVLQGLFSLNDSGAFYKPLLGPSIVELALLVRFWWASSPGVMKGLMVPNHLGSWASRSLTLETATKHRAPS